jgi:subtilisin family serine protease
MSEKENAVRFRPILSLTAGLTLATLASAGTIGRGLSAQLDTLHPGDEVKVMVILEARADVELLDQALREKRASMAERHLTVITALKDVAAESQPALVSELDRLQQKGIVLGYTPHWLLNGIVVRTLASGVPELAQLPGVDVVEADLVPELIEPVQVDESQGRENSREIGITPGIQALQADRVWYELGITGEGVVVANMDTGVNVNHESLSARWRGNFANASHCWWDAWGSSSTPNDGNGHGTHVMGTITGLASGDSIGVCPGAQWIATNVIDSGTGSAFDNAVIAGLEWLSDPDNNAFTVDDMPDVVQHSWGVNEGFSGYTDCDNRWWEAIDNCEALGVVNTWSAGNEGPSGSTMRSPADRATSATNCFSVGSCNTSGTTISSFSSRGPAGNNCGFYNIKPEVTAPGDNIYSANASSTTGYVYMSGTSMAGPHVAGVVGLMRGANPDLDVQSIKTILMETCEDRGTTGEDNIWGWGLVNAYEAVLAASSGFAEISGTITAEDTGEALAGILVEVPEANRTAVTDANGQYNLTMPAGEFEFQASGYGFESHLWTILLESQDVVVSDQSLDRLPSAMVMGTVRAPDGSPLSEAVVEALGTPLAPQTTDLDGRFQFLLPVSYEVTIVSRANDLPTSVAQGPDAYGYFAFDSSDWASVSQTLTVPAEGADLDMISTNIFSYDWLALDPDEGGVGTALDFSAGDDITVLQDLPFDFMYYGISYSQISICGNGWVAFGNTDETDYSNSAIPDGTDGPAAMVAVMWEDYSPQQEVSGNISVYHDQAGGRFIIEYNHIRQYTPISAFESFQLILMDPTMHETVSGDGAMILQYSEITDTSSATVGIESPDASTGLQYYFADSGDNYADENLPIEAGSAILITTGLTGSQAPLSPVTDLSIELLPNLNLLLGWTPAAGAVSYRVEEKLAEGWVPLGETAASEWLVEYHSGVGQYRVISLAPDQN